MTIADAILSVVVIAVFFYLIYFQIKKKRPEIAEAITNLAPEEVSGKITDKIPAENYERRYIEKRGGI